MQPSPYTPGEIARSLPGRTAELGEFNADVERLLTRRLLPRIRVDHGARGYGKTSLLREYERLAHQNRLLTVFVTAGESPIIPQISAQLRAHAPKGPAIAKQLEILELQVGFSPIGHVRAEVRPQTVPAAASRALEAVVSAVADGTPHRGLVILVDEVQSADPDGLRALAYAWQDLQREAPDLPAGVFTAGLPNSPDVISAAVTFAERFRFRPIGALPEPAEELAIAEPARELGVIWDRAALERATAIAGGYPYFVQLIADHSWAAAGSPDPGATIDSDAVERAEVLMQNDLDALYRARWAQATDGEQQLMRAIASFGEKPAARTELAKQLGKDSAALSVPRQRLIDKGMIAPEGRGRLVFTLPGFAAYIEDLDS